MNPDTWATATSVAPGELREATLQLHWATQFIAAAGQTFAEPKDDDSHRAMIWDRDLRAFVGAPFAGPYPFRVAVRPEDLTLMLIDGSDGELGALPLAGATRAQGYEWLGLGMATYLGSPPPEIEQPEYEMPEHGVGAEARFSAGLETELQALTALYDGAATLLSDLVAGRAEASSVLCWPHHFDIATLFTLERGHDGKATKTIGVGLAPMGGGYEEWYLYVSPWPWPAPGSLPELAGPGRWHTEGWTGVILTGQEAAALSGGARTDTVRAFLAEAIEAATAALT